jgi:hypothetical protein
MAASMMVLAFYIASADVLMATENPQSYAPKCA